MEFLHPHIVTEYFDISDGMNVLEFYVGSGHFTPHLRKKVGSYGSVRSFEQNDYANENKGSNHSLSNKVDRVTIINAPAEHGHHQIFSRAYASLVPGGKVIFIESRTGNCTNGQAIHFAGLAGFIHEKNFNAGEHHYGLVLKKL